MTPFFLHVQSARKYVFYASAPLAESDFRTMLSGTGDDKSLKNQKHRPE